MSSHLSAVFELKDKFSATMARAEKGIRRMGKGMSDWKKKSKEAASATSSTASALKKFAAAAGAVKLVSAGVGFVKDAYLGYSELNAVLTRTSSIMGGTAKDTELLKKQSMALGREMPFSAKEVAEAQKFQAMAGMKSNAVLALTPKLLKAAIANGSDLAKTSDIITDNLDAFGLKISEVDRLMDVMTATANNSNTDMMLLGEAYQYVASASKGFDNLEDVNILLGILANNGIKGAKAGRNLGAMYSRLAKPTAEMKKAMMASNTTLYDAQGHFKGLRRIIQEAKPALDSMSDAQKNNWLATMAGAEGLKIWNSIANYSAEDTKRVATAIEKSSGAVQKAYDVQKETPANKIKALSSAWDGLKLSIGEGASPALTGLVEDLTRYINDLADSGTFDKENVDAFYKAAVDGGKETLSVVRELGEALAPVTAGIKVVWGIRAATEELTTSLWTSRTPDQLDREHAIREELKAAEKMDASTPEQDAKKKKRWIAAKKKQDELYNEYWKARNLSGMGTELVKKKGIEGMADTSDTAKYDAQYYNIGKGNRGFSKKEAPGPLQASSAPTLEAALARNKQGLGLGGPMDVNVNLTGTIIKENTDVDKIAKIAGTKIEKRIAAEMRAQLAVQQ